MLKRRSFIKGAASIAPLSVAARVAGADDVPDLPARDYYKELGLTPFINAAGAYSSYGGARMRPEVVAAMRHAATHKVKMRELHDAVGARIAELVGSESAMVTSGATAAMVLVVAACMTLDDKEKISQLPNTTGMKNEVII